ncbi:alpha/beta hydrolase family protein [Castellaniella sp. WN]
MEDISLVDFGSFHVGGHHVVLKGRPAKEIHYSPNWIERYEQDGTYMVGQMYVQYFIPTSDHPCKPLVFWPGGGLTGVNFETTPDGRPGWLDYFLRLGYPVYNTDPVERGRSGWCPYPEIYQTEPTFMTAERGFESFRFGRVSGYHIDPDHHQVIDGTEFPTAAYEQFIKQIVPRWTCNADMAKAAYVKLLDMLGPSIILAFSSGATQALELAQERPELFDMLILIEPAGFGPNPCDADRMKDLPILVVYGDCLDKHPQWPDIRHRAQVHLDPILEGRGRAAIVDLPSMGIRGNSHFMMMDRNNHVVADVLASWLRQTKRP